MVRQATVTSLLLGLVLALSLVLAPAKPASAQQNIKWGTAFQIQNLDANGSATVNVRLINQNGSEAGKVTDTILPSGSATYFISVKFPTLTTFNGSAIIDADRPVAAILNIDGSSGAYNEAVTGISQGSTSVSLPLLHRGNGGFNTWFAVQNVGTATTTVQVTYTPASINGSAPIGNSYTSPSTSIPAGASVTFDQSLESNLGAKFVGSAIVTSTSSPQQPLAVIVNQVGTGNIKTALVYSGFPKGSNEVSLPLVQHGSGWETGISIQNSGAVEATVNIAYSASTGTAPASVTGLKLPIGGIAIIPVRGTTRFVGSAKITTGATNQEVVVVANQTSAVAGSTYEGISITAATAKVSLPLLMANNGGFFTGVQCQNVGTAPITLSLDYSIYNNPKTGEVVNPNDYSKPNMAVNESVNILQDMKMVPTATSVYVGSGTVTATTSDGSTPKVVCVANEFKDSAVDTFLTYNGVPMSN